MHATKPSADLLHDLRSPSSHIESGPRNKDLEEVSLIMNFLQKVCYRYLGTFEYQPALIVLVQIIECSGLKLISQFTVISTSF